MRIWITTILLFFAIAYPFPFDVSACNCDPKRFVASASDEIVIYNFQTKKYHDQACMWAKRCTVHCIPLKRTQAIDRGGIPCKVCGGGNY